jgi:hypothetical protein
LSVHDSFLSQVSPRGKDREQRAAGALLVGGAVMLIVRQTAKILLQEEAS